MSTNMKLKSALIGLGAALSALAIGTSGALAADTQPADQGFNSVREARALHEAGGAAFADPVTAPAKTAAGVEGRAGATTAVEGPAGMQKIDAGFNTERVKRGLRESSGPALGY